MFRCKGCNACAVFASLILGAVIAVLFYFRFIPNIIALIPIPFWFAIVTLVGLVLIPLLAHRISPCALKCVCINGYCLLGAAVGTLVTTIAAFAIDLDPKYISVTVLVGLGGFFFSLLLIAIIIFIDCLLRELCCRC